MSRAYKNKKFNTDNYTKYGVSPKYFGVQASRFPGSIKKQYCDEDSNGFADATYTKRRAEAVRKGTGCVQRVILSPDFGPENLGFAVPKSGPLDLSQVKPDAGPSNLSSGFSASSFGPTSLSSIIVKPATGPTNLLGEPQLNPQYGPINLSASIPPPRSVYKFTLIAGTNLSGNDSTPFARISTTNVTAGTEVEYTWTEGLNVNGGSTVIGWKRTSGPNITSLKSQDFIYEDGYFLRYWSGVTLVGFGVGSLPVPPTGTDVYPFGNSMKYQWKDAILTP